MNNKYKDYFDIDEDYFPQINDSSIKAARKDFWMQTYPHDTFIEMIKGLERILARQEMRSLWIEGAYGTGKSQCAFALKKILDVTEEDLKAYWKRYDSLNSKNDLLQKLIGHKEKGVITAYRYASGSIDNPRDLFVAIQESVKDSLVEKGLYSGENTLKDNILDWLQDPDHKDFFDKLLKKEQWRSLFSQTSVNDVILSLQKGNEVKELVSNIFRLADKEGITAMNINADMLQNWLKDVIDKTKKKIVFIWDEFSDYFKNNKNTLSEFQKIVELVNDYPFYLIIVTHESGQLFSAGDQAWNRLRNRFIPIEIFLPDNIAFNLIGHAFNVKKVAKEQWEIIADDLNSRLSESRNIVMKATGISEEKVIKEIMPLHPMAALMLTKIASAFKSNQRSMFDFIKSTNSNDVEAFQWFIDKNGPYDNHPLLTVDLLWDFFYEKGRNHLSPDIRLVLDTYRQQQDLQDDEKAVLKVILMMQAIDQRLGGDFYPFKATDQNLSYVFEGIASGLDSNAKNIAKALVSKKILISSPIKGGGSIYKVAILSGDQEKIDNYKKEVKNNSTTSKLVTDGNISSVLSLSTALKLRFEIENNTGKLNVVTAANFKKQINDLYNKELNWKFKAVIAFAIDEDEASKLRNLIKSAVSDESYKNIIFIDALSIPLGDELLSQFIDYSAMSLYYAMNDNKESNENKEKAKNVLELEWKNKIYKGQFTVYTYTNQEGEKVANGQEVSSILQAIVSNRFPLVYDFNKNLSENQFKLTSAKACSKCGIIRQTNGVVVGIENHILPSEWSIDRYWENTISKTSKISKIKLQLDNLIQSYFDREYQISIGDVYDFLENKYGFAPTNLSAFLTGFLLKEYSSDPYRYSDSVGGHETMTPDKLAEMISNYINKSPKKTYIVKMTIEEKAFYEFTENVWNIIPNTCSSIVQITKIVSQRMKDLKLPVWCLEEVDDNGVFYIVKKYIELVQSEGKIAHSIAIEIGKIALQNPNVIEIMHDLLTNKNCQKGMLIFLKSFENGLIMKLADEINAKDIVLSDIQSLFEVKHSCLWERKTGENEINKLAFNYGIVKTSNTLLNINVNSYDLALKEWTEKLKFIKISNEALISKYPQLTNVIKILLKIYQRSDILPEQVKEFNSDLNSNISAISDIIENDFSVFLENYALYLDNLEESEIKCIYIKLPTTMFQLPRSESNSKVNEIAKEFRKNQQKTKMINIWKDKTDSKNPKDWSYINRIPILSCVDKNEYDEAKKVFGTLNRSLSNDDEIRRAIDFLESTNLFDILSDKDKLIDIFKRDIIGEYLPLLPNVNIVRDTLERLVIEPYEWRENPKVKIKIKELAEAEYHSGGSDRALSKIDNMKDAQLKEYLKVLVKANMRVGIEIIGNEEE